MLQDAIPFASNKTTLLQSKSLQAAATVAGFVLASPALGSFVIDSFAIDQGVLVAATGGLDSTDSASRAGPIAGTAANERSVFASIDAPIDDSQVSNASISIGRGALAFTFRSDGAIASDPSAYLQASWRYTAGVDLTAAGNTFEIASTFSGTGIELTLWAVDLAGNMASFAFSPGGTRTIGFAATGWNVAGAPVNFASIEYLMLDWTADGTLEGSTPAATSVQSLRVIPAPASLAVLFLAALCSRRRVGRSRL
jgi:hypothetical protein